MKLCPWFWSVTRALRKSRRLPGQFRADDFQSRQRSKGGCVSLLKAGLSYIDDVTDLVSSLAGEFSASLLKAASCLV